MAPSLARYAWLPLVGATAWLATEEVAIYRRVYTAARYVAYRQGYDVRNTEAMSEPRTRAAGVAGAVGGGAATFLAIRWAVDRILLSKKPDRGRLFDTLNKADRSGPPLTLSRTWQLLGPSATPATLREFGRSHGLVVVSTLVAAMWAVMVAPYTQARAECMFLPRGDPLEWGETRRAREAEAAAEIRAAMPTAAASAALRPPPSGPTMR